MCGIVAAVARRNVVPILLEGLKRRGQAAIHARAVHRLECLARFGEEWSYARMDRSTRRAGAAKAGLVNEGVPPGAITTVGKGETELLVQTADGVKEPQNRRAAIEEMPATGSQVVAFDGRADDGAPLRGGVYFYEIRSADGSRVGRFAILR